MDENIKQRFAFIEFLLLFKGRVTRNELVERFSIGEATASRLIASYLEEFPSQMHFLGARVGYGITPESTFYFPHSVEEALRYIGYGVISQQFQVETFGTNCLMMNVDLDLKIVSTITRAIAGNARSENSCISIEYVSTSSGKSMKYLKPHSIFKAGNAWYLRAFEISKQAIENNEYVGSFKTFKFTRVSSVKDTEMFSDCEIGKERDDEWNRQRTLRLTAHPKMKHPESQELDLGLKHGGYKDLFVSEALLGFALLDLRVDCSQTRKLNPFEYPLCLENREELLYIPSMKMAPGFVESNKDI